jgi:sugar phosphate permease
MSDRSDPPRQGVHWAWIILLVCFVNLFINYGIRLGYGVLLPEMIRTMGITRREAGDIFNAYFFAYVCFSPFTGYLTDRLGAARVIPVFGILLGLGTLLMGMVTQFWQACLAFALVGIGASAMWTPVITLVQRWFSIKKRGMALGILSTGFGLGYATMGRLYPVIVSKWSWHYCWFILGTSALLMIVVNRLLLRSKPDDVGLSPWGEGSGEKGPPQASAVKVRISYREIFTVPRFWMIGFSYFFIAATLYVTSTFMVDYARHELGFPYDKASLLATIHGLGQIAGVLTIPMASDYIGRRMTILLSNLCIAGCTAGIVLSGGSVVALFTSVGLLGAFFGATFPMYGASGGDYFRKEIVGSVIGLLTFFYGVGAIVAHRFGGQVRDVTGSFSMPFAGAILAALLAALFMLFVGRKPREGE